MRYLLLFLALTLLLGALCFLESQQPHELALKVSSSPIDADRLLASIDSGLVTGRSDQPNQAIAGYDSIIRNEALSAKDPALLRLGGHSFDPLLEPPISSGDRNSGSILPRHIAKAAAAFGETSYRILQFDEPLSSNRRMKIERAGVRVVAYIPNNAYVIALDRKSSIDLDDLNGIRWTGMVPPEIKIADGLMEMLSEDPLHDGESILQISLFRGEDREAFGQLLLELGAEELLRISENGRPVITATVDHTKLHQIVHALQLCDAVEAVRLFSPPKLLNKDSIWLLQSGNAEHEFTPLFDMGLTGWGQIYAAADSGIDTDACQFRYSSSEEAQTLAARISPPETDISNPDDKVIAYYVLSGAQEYDETSGNYHGTMTTGCAVGDDYHDLADQENPGINRSDGMAPGARVVFQDVASSTGFLLGLAFNAQYDIHTQAYESGARVHNNSYGLENPSTEYDIDSRALDEFSWDHPDYQIFFSAGNSGPEEGTLTGEGSTAKNILCVGATTPGSLEGGKDVVTFSSRGPTQDGRLKPDIMAPGIVESATETTKRRLEGYTNVYGYPAYESSTVPPNNQCATELTFGTSFSSPTAAGMGLLARQYFTDGYYPGGERNEEDGFIPSSALIRAVMINSSRSLEGDLVGFNGHSATFIENIEHIPSSYQGWGRITLDDALYLKGDRRDLEVLADIEAGSEGALSTGDMESFELFVKSGEAFKITLAWTDPPASAWADKALVNDLDLEVESPSGDLYRGNINFENGYSRTSTSGEADRINSNEQVLVASPERGLWTIRVIGESVPGDGSTRPFDSGLQGYALIATGDLGEEADVLLPHIAATKLSVSGGCDDDISLDINETVTVTFAIKNSGDGDSSAITANIAVLPELTDIDPEHLIFEDGEFSFDSVLAKSTSNMGIRVGLADHGEDVCGKSATFQVRVRDADGKLWEDMLFTLPLGLDYLADGSTDCQRDLCNPPPEITKFTPSNLYLGVKGLDVKMKGHHMRQDMILSFSPDVIEYDALKVYSPIEAELDDVSIDVDAPLGLVSLTISSEDGINVTYEDILEILAREADGDEDVIEQSDEELESTPPEDEGSSGGCSSTTSPGLAGLVIACLSMLAMRRRRRH